MTKPKRQIRDKSIKIRLNADELAQFKQRQIGDELASWVRSVCLGNPLQPPKKTKQISIKTADPELLRQLAKIGSNLNQIARAVNTQQAHGNIISFLRLTTELAIIREQLSEILKQNDN
ncbi:putative mobilization protein C (plasmid) [Moraxella macacae 0408225]|uniref:Putative mobilization protein C n=1 Tax=Moraxella macacae 0408225 TaxID=1230338 RepID=L2F4Z0_9GAMM|nr:plasmid mobilization relaxosome protein MobC [Moraxella macacae]ELA07975.1 putative mobilization protein C [Moraxella macacae 0408225]